MLMIIKADGIRRPLKKKRMTKSSDIRWNLVDKYAAQLLESRRVAIPLVSYPNRYVSQATKRAVLIRDEGRCVRCGQTEDLQFDHIIPITMGGSSEESNIQLLCGLCNRRKSNKIEPLSNIEIESVKIRKRTTEGRVILEQGLKITPPCMRLTSEWIDQWIAVHCDHLLA
jgi:5-methylcytosine-specific restriction endonuclease McrA